MSPVVALNLLLPRALRPLGVQDPIAGPLVAVARAVGVLPEEEEDGWRGQPLTLSFSLAREVNERHLLGKHEQTES